MNRSNFLREPVLNLNIAAVNYLYLIHKFKDRMLGCFFGRLWYLVCFLKQHVLSVVRQIEEETEGMREDHEATNPIHFSAQGANDLNVVSVARNVAFQTHRDDVA